MKKRLSRLFSLFAVILLLLTSCSSKVINDGSGGSNMARDEALYESAEKEPNVGTSISENTNVDDGRKIIETIELSVQTKEFDSLMDSLNKQISELGGYVESSNVYGREIDSATNRRANLTIRIPSDTSNEFTAFVSENSVVTNESITTKDVTLSYVDMESRVAALEAEKAALEKLLESASTMTDIIDIRDKLTDVIYEIESYKSQLRTYDNLVDYSTVTVNIYEVERTVIVEEQNTWEKIGTNLKNNFENVWDGTVAVFIFIVSAIPYFIPVAIIAVIVIVTISVSKKNKKKKNNNLSENSQN